MFHVWRIINIEREVSALHWPWLRTAVHQWDKRQETRETLFALKWVVGVGWQLEMSAVGGWEREVRQVSEACTGAGAHIPASQHWPGGGSFLSITGNVTGNWGFESRVSFTVNLLYLDNIYLVYYKSSYIFPTARVLQNIHPWETVLVSDGSCKSMM